MVYHVLDFSLYFSSKTNWQTNTKEHLLTFTQTLISMCTHFLICEVKNNDGNYLIWLRKLGELIYLKAHNKFLFMLTIIITVKTAITHHHLINPPNEHMPSTSYIKTQCLICKPKYMWLEVSLTFIWLLKNLESLYAYRASCSYVMYLVKRKMSS